MQYRKKPVVIDAFQVRSDNVQQVAEWCGGRPFGGSPTRAEPHITISTLEGDMRANNGDYVIRGVKGEFYPCKPDIFAATYEAVN
jgi:hypothetical protein